MAVRARKRFRSRASSRISRIVKPANLSLSEWQVALRRQHAADVRFEVKNIGDDAVFSEFTVRNPVTDRTYRVALRGERPGDNFCACPDYAVNTLGTCKHIEYVLRRVRRGNAQRLRAGHHPRFAEVYLRYGARRQLVFSAGEGCPEALKRIAAEWFDENGLRDGRDLTQLDEFFRRAQRASQVAGYDLRVYDDALAYIAEARDAAHRRAVLDVRYSLAGNSAQWKDLVNVALFPYQRAGALFAARAGRAIIADEMGLGKTIQAIAASELLAREFAAERALIVCPSSLKYQWLSELQRFTSRAALVIGGPTHRRAEQFRNDDSFFKIVNYDVIQRDLGAIAAWRPDIVILDEAQRVKNWQTRAARSIKQIDSRFAIALTGTPLENRIDELHSIVEFIDRFRLGPLFAFKAAHEEHKPDSTRVIGYRNLSAVTKTLAPILIRRTKAEVLSQLPPRMDKNFFVPMTKEQWVPHEENREMVAKLVQKWNRFKFLSEADQLRLRISLQYMRMSCDSTYLIDKVTRHGDKVGEIERLLDEVFETPGAKVVMFSQWTGMQQLVAEMLDARGWGHVLFHGGVSSKDRRARIEDFKTQDDCRIFLSTDAGGVGLNLQHASNLINIDLPWNPAVLEQRIGRVHRLGQKQPVRVVNFVAEGAIEHGILSLLKFKQAMFAGVLDGAADHVSMGDGAMSRFIKTIERATTATPDVCATPAEIPKPSSVAADDTGVDADSTPPPSEVAAPAAHVADGQAAGTAMALPIDALAPLLKQGALLLGAIATALSAPAASGAAGEKGGFARIEVDETTGKRELRFLLPEQPVMAQWVTQLSTWISALHDTGARTPR